MSGLYDTLCVLQREIGLCERFESPELSYLLKLVMDGRYGSKNIQNVIFCCSNECFVLDGMIPLITSSL